MKLGLVLSGGGALGAFEAGVVAAIEDAGLRPDVLSGTSAGALNAAGLAAGFDAARLAEVWTSTSTAEVYRLRRDVLELLRFGELFRRGVPLAQRLLAGIGWSWLFDTAPLRATLLDAFGGEVVPLADDRPLVVSAVEVATGGLVRFATRAPQRPSRAFRVVDDLTVDHLLASASIPIAFKPGTVGETAYWDGGIVANTPLAPALAYEPDVVIIVTTSTVVRPAPPPRSFGDAISLLVDTLLAHSLAADLARAEAVNAACRAGAMPERKVVDFLQIGPQGLDLGRRGLLEFDPGKAARYVALGHQVGAEALKAWQAEGRLPE